MRNQHNWTERTDEGLKREVRAAKFGKVWTIQSKLEGEEFWTTHDNPEPHDVEQLYDILFRKYQRKRVTWDDVAFVEAWMKRVTGKA